MGIKKENVSGIAHERLCSSCGACFSVCPASAIKFEETVGGYYLPVVDGQACSKCGLCLDVCPGLGFCQPLLDKLPQYSFSGTALEAYIGKAAEKQLYNNSQSGGGVSAILLRALDDGRIKGAVTVTMEEGSPPRPAVHIARTKNDLLYAQKSKYCPVPLLSFLRDLKDEDVPLAVVGVSCQIHGLLNILEKLPKIKGKVAFTIGLVCDRVMTYAGIDYLLSESGAGTHTQSMLYFRDKAVSGYPGDVHVIRNGKSIILPASVRMGIKDYFTPARCRICFDKMNIFSDITVGDPHGIEDRDAKNGESVLVVRTENGMKAMVAARDKGDIILRTVDYAQILKGQRIDKKREQWRRHIEEWKASGMKVPNFYERVASAAPVAAKPENPVQNIKYSISLDSFNSRDKLLNDVRRRLRKQKLLSKLGVPLEFGRKIKRKILGMLGGSAKVMPANRKTRLVEIRNTPFRNKGAELMLCSCVHQLRERIPDVSIAVPPMCNPYIRRAEMGLYQKAWFYCFKSQCGYYVKLIPKKIRELYGIVLDSEIDLILDASGFTYGDQMGSFGSIETANAIRKWKRQGTKIVLLPQAFGPFENPDIKESFKIIAEHADLIYARDRQSFGYVTKVAGVSRKIRIAPDFTNLLEGIIPANFDSKSNRFCIIPNYKMIEKADMNQRNCYVPLVSSCLKYLHEKGAKPFILIHEGEKDLELGREIARSSGKSVNIIENTHAIHLKGIIGACDGVIGSRFHGLVSALSQGVPAIGLGWSHKYGMLLEDYGFPEGIFTANADKIEVYACIDKILSCESSSAIRKIISAKAQTQKQDTKKMWDDVFTLASSNP